jgi:hypothetical protein
MFRRQVKWFVLGALGLLGFGLADPAWHCAWAGDKIILSDRNDAITNRPLRLDISRRESDLEKNLGLPERKPSLDSSSGIFVVPSSPRPRLISRQQLQELDRRKNWIYVTPEMMTQSLSANEALNVREMDLEGNSAKPKKVMQLYMDRMMNEPQSTNRFAKGSLTQSNMFDNPSRAGGSQTGQNLSGLPRTSELNTSPPLGSDRALNPLSGLPIAYPENLFLSSGSPLFSVLDPAVSPFQELTRQMHQRADQEFQQLLRPTKSGLPLGGPNDPINYLTDTTRKELQPVLPRKPEETARGKDLRDPLAFQHGLGRGLQHGGFDDLNSKVLGPSSLAPAIVSPAPPPSVAPRPISFEPPKRKF